MALITLQWEIKNGNPGIKTAKPRTKRTNLQNRSRSGNMPMINTPKTKEQQEQIEELKQEIQELKNNE